MGCRVGKVSAAPVLVHAFSHFRLHISPMLLNVTPGHAAMEPGRQWLQLDDSADAALPAPIRRILEQVQASGSKPLLSRKR